MDVAGDFTGLSCHWPCLRFSAAATPKLRRWSQQRRASECRKWSDRSDASSSDRLVRVPAARASRSAVLFFVDAMTAQPHDPDINGLLRQCNVHNIPVATNPATAELVLDGLTRRLAGSAV
jgi:hypothetical protein